MASIAAYTNHKTQEALLNAALADLTALRTAFLALTAKLDADAGITDTNYAATVNPAALTLVV